MLRRFPVMVVPVAVLVGGCAGAAAHGTPSAHTAPTPAASPARRGCTVTARRTLRHVAMRAYAQVAHGPNVVSAVRRVSESRALAAAVARGDAGAARRALHPLLRAQITRIVVTRGGRVLASLGSGAAPAPVRGTIRGAAGTPVGRYTLSVGDDSGLADLIHRLTGDQVVFTAGGREVAGTVTAGRAALSRPGVSSFPATAFPHGSLRVWLLNSAAAPRACGVVDTIGLIGERLVRDESAGAATVRVLHVVAHDPRFAAAVAARHPAAVRAQIVRFFQDPSLHVVRIRAVTPTGRLINDVGGPYVLAPATTTVRQGGHVVGRVTLSIQDDTGYIKLMHRFTGAKVLLRTAAGRVPGSTLSPGRNGRVFSFTTRAFPSGPLRVSLLVP